jgi:ribonuclease-3 family protein
MTDYFDFRLSPEELGAVSNLGLAHIGDAVYDLLVRSWCLGSGKLTNERLHSETVRRVSAAAQSRAAERIGSLLTEEELAVFRRGRNTRVNSVPKHAEIGDYHAATGLECLFGWLYLRADRARINELFSVIMEGETCR